MSHEEDSMKVYALPTVLQLNMFLKPGGCIYNFDLKKYYLLKSLPGLLLTVAAFKSAY